MKGGDYMSAAIMQEKGEKVEATEFIQLLKGMSKEDKQKVKGIMIGINLSKEKDTARALMHT